MGTRAQFFVGDPRDLVARDWLGTIAWAGYPQGECGALAKATTERKFRNAVARLAASRDDFCDPAIRRFPFPWSDDLFLTDYTYAWFDGAVQMTCFHRGFTPLAAYLKGGEEAAAAYHEGEERLSKTVPAPGDDDLPRGPDSILIIRA